MAVISSTPDRITPLKNDIRSPRCTTCGKTFTKQAGNFPASQSPIYACNNHFLPVCKTCIDKLYEHYCAVLGNDEDAIRRICMKFDIYYSKALAESSRKIAVDRSRVHTYISRANLSQFRGKTYDTTIDEESRQVIESVEEVKESGVKMSTNFFRINMMIGRHGMNVRQNLRKKSLKQFALRSLIYSVPTFPAIKKSWIHL